MANSTRKVVVTFKIIMTTSVTRSCFTIQHQTFKTKTKTDFLVSDRSSPKTDRLRPHHWIWRTDNSISRHCCNSEEGTCSQFSTLTQVCDAFGVHSESFLPRDAMRKRGLCYRPVSVRLSRWSIVSRRQKIWSYFFLSPIGPSFDFWTREPLLNSKGNPFRMGAKYMGWKNEIVDGNRRLSRKRYEIGPCVVAMER